MDVKVPQHDRECTIICNLFSICIAHQLLMTVNKIIQLGWVFKMHSNNRFSTLNPRLKYSNPKAELKVVWERKRERVRVQVLLNTSNKCSWQQQTNHLSITKAPRYQISDRFVQPCAWGSHGETLKYRQFGNSGHKSEPAQHFRMDDGVWTGNTFSLHFGPIANHNGELHITRT